MTEREPFAKVEEVILGTTSLGLFLCIGSDKIHLPDQIQAGMVAVRINAEYESRMKEAEKKAVEEFRERAADVAWKMCEGKCGGFPGCKISNEILGLPTEPEERK